MLQEDARSGKIIRKLLKNEESEKTSISFEFFPARTEDGVFNLLKRVEEMGFSLQPTFVSLTWRSAFTDEKLWLKIGQHIQQHFQMDVLLHLTCHLDKTCLKRILNGAREAGIRNILALRGDPPIGSEKWAPVANGLSNAWELIELIRSEHGDYFCIACAGYPEVHTESWNQPLHLPPSEQARTLDLQRLKQKVDAGADFIITQFFYDVDNVIAWIKNCRDIGINVPILPGYLPIQNYNSFCKFTNWCKSKVPNEVLSELKMIRNDDAKVKEYGVELAIKTCNKLMTQGGCKSLHFYTMNLATSVTQILTGLNLITLSNNQLRGRHDSAKNSLQESRPIFWSHRESSYISRTSDWDDFPNGRWGDRSSPAYGELNEYYLAFKRPKVNRKIIWKEPTNQQDVWKVFCQYIEGTVKQLPWCEQSLSSESYVITENLRWINSMGFLTINSQPRVNGVPSSDPVFGWGGDDGFVFQKAYVEFFTSPEMMSKLLVVLKDYPSLSYHALDLGGKEYMNSPEGSVNAVTWGVFPGHEIIQPTVVDSASFVAWKDEAFRLWVTQWASAYDEGSVSKKVIEDIYQSYFLVNIVDNNYTSDHSDIFDVFKVVIANGMTKDELRDRLFDVESQNEKMRESVSKLQAIQADTMNDVNVIQDKLTQSYEENNRLKSQIRDLQTKLALQHI